MPTRQQNLLLVAWRGKAEVNSPKLQLDESILNAGQPEIMHMMKFKEKKKKTERKGFKTIHRVKS